MACSRFAGLRACALTVGAQAARMPKWELDVAFVAFAHSGLVALLWKASGKPAAKLARGGEKGLVIAR